jgi:hypothetical protein
VSVGLAVSVSVTAASVWAVSVPTAASVAGETSVWATVSVGCAASVWIWASVPALSTGPASDLPAGVVPPLPQPTSAVSAASQRTIFCLPHELPLGAATKTATEIRGTQWCQSGAAVAMAKGSL